jgi:O-antigen/teichoic acid export membrane protein
MNLSKKSIVSGIIWVVLGSGGSQFLRFVNNLILTRLLSPELFGLMAIVSTFLIGLNQFSDIGIAPSIVQSKKGDDRVFLNTAWTIQVLRGLGLWLVSWIIAWPVARFFERRELLWLLPIVGFNAVIQGLTSTSIITLNKSIKIKNITLLEQGTQLVAILVMITWAWFSPSIWALVVGGLVSSTLRMVLSHFLIKGYSNHFAWHRETIQEITNFGRWIFISTAVLFLANQSDRLMIGKLFPIELLGVYTVAITLAELPRMVGGSLSLKIIFPLVARATELSRQTLKSEILKYRQKILIGLAFLLAILVSFGDYLITLLYDARYHQAVWMLPILALGIWPTTLFQTANPILLGIGQSIYGAIGQSLKFMYMIVCLPLSYFLLKPWHLELLGVILVIALNDLLLYMVVSYGMWKENLSIFKQDLLITSFFLLNIIIAVLIRDWFNLGLPIDKLLLRNS